MSGLSEREGFEWLTLDAKFAAKVVLDPSGCLLWQGATCRGYGHLRRDRTWKAHRWAYRLAHGSIDPLLVIDHLCRTRLCVNPAHMELVTREENLNRGVRSPLKPGCPQGHPYSADNTYLVGKRRHCRTCRRAASRRWQARKAAA